MGIFGSKHIDCPAGQWITLIHTSFAQMPKNWTVTFRSVNGHKVEGTYTEKKSMWIIPGAPTSGPISQTQIFERGYWNTFYSVMVKLDVDAVAEIE